MSTAAPSASDRAQELFLAALDRHRRGDAAAAESLYRDVVRWQPLHSDAMHLWGVARQQQGHGGDALAAIRRALMINRTSTAYLANLAGVCRGLGRVDQAADCCLAALAQAPARIDLRLQLAALRRAQGRGDESAEACRDVLAVAPDCLDALSLLGNVLQEEGRAEEAAAVYRRALGLAPHSADILNNLARALEALGRVDEAIDAYRCAVRIDGNRPAILNNLGSALRAKGDLPAALKVLQAATSAAPNDPAGHHNLANAWRDVGRLDAAAAGYRRAIACNSEFAESHAALAAVLSQEGDVDGAACALASAIRVKPLDRWRIQAALLFPPILRSKDELVARRAALLENVDALVAEDVHIDPAREPAVLNFYLAYQGFCERDVQQRIARLGRSSHVFRRRSAPGAGQAPRVGFLSRYFRNHTIGRLFCGLIAGLFRDGFDITVISIGRHDDEIARAVRAASSRYVEIGENIPAALGIVAGLDLDALFYTDLGMEPVSWTLAHSRLAPVQCAAWGHPLTTGLPTIDYFVSSRLFERDDADAHYTETLVRLESLGFCYERPSAARRSRSDFGLPEGRTLYGCPQSLFKLHPDFDGLLGEILRRDSRGQIVLLAGMRTAWQRLLCERFARTIPDVASRICFVPRVSHGAFLALCSTFDVLLDPIHFGGGNTSLEALSAGVPIVTLPSDYLRGRITAGLYCAMGMTDCIVDDCESYVDRAVRLGRDEGLRHSLGLQIRDRANVLFDDVRAAAETGRFLLSAIGRAKASA